MLRLTISVIALFGLSACATSVDVVVEQSQIQEPVLELSADSLRRTSILVYSPGSDAFRVSKVSVYPDSSFYSAYLHRRSSRLARSGRMRTDQLRQIRLSPQAHPVSYAGLVASGIGGLMLLRASLYDGNDFRKIAYALEGGALVVGGFSFSLLSDLILSGRSTNYNIQFIE